MPLRETEPTLKPYEEDTLQSHPSQPREEKSERNARTVCCQLNCL